MNPLKWKREHQVALFLFVALGCWAGTFLWYLTGGSRLSTSGWSNLIHSGILAWGVYGGVASGLVIYAVQLFRR